MKKILATLTISKDNILAMHVIYDKLFHYDHTHDSFIQVDLKEKKSQSFSNAERNLFHRLISLQRTLVKHASLEPTLWWVNNAFSSKLYNTLVEQQTNTYRMLLSIDESVRNFREFIIY